MQGAKAKKQKQEEEAAAALETHLSKTEEEGRKSPEKEGRDKDDYVRTQQKKLMPDLQGEMRDYQVKGVKWLISLWNVSHLVPFWSKPRYLKGLAMTPAECRMRGMVFYSFQSTEMAGCITPRSKESRSTKQRSSLVRGLEPQSVVSVRDGIACVVLCRVLMLQNQPEVASGRP